jgi:hypothetical protein
MTETKTETSVVSCLDSECPEQSVTSSCTSSSSLPPDTMTLSGPAAYASSRPAPPPSSDDGQGLASFLIQRACYNSCLANYFYWYLHIECEESEGGGHKPDHLQAVFWIHRIHVFFGLPDPDPLVRGMDPDPALDPDPDSSIIMLK